MSDNLGNMPPNSTSRTKKLGRTKVEVGRTGFMAGTQFRTFFEMDIPATQKVTFKVVAPVDFVFSGLNFDVDNGGLRVRTLAADAVESGTFDQPVPIIPRNSMAGTPAYVPTLTLNYGGSVTGGTVLDVARTIAGKNASQTVNSSNFFDGRGIAAGTYYVEIESLDVGGTGNLTGVMFGFWEEQTEEFDH